MIEVDVTLERPGFRLEVAFTTSATTLGIFGPSGAGKSTILAIIAGLIRPDRGVVRIDGRTLFDAAEGIDVRVDRRRIGMVFQ
ncbi:MAG: ATP-binding cassette domain-containing protein, partial [Phycisphaeraceae bacterium]|nr:ATP-binding cassette domain-containing protein [Phycisphaeraceae bacterium]